MPAADKIIRSKVTNQLVLLKRKSMSFLKKEKNLSPGVNKNEQHKLKTNKANGTQVITKCGFWFHL